MDGFGEFLWAAAEATAAANFLIQLFLNRRRLPISLAVALAPVFYTLATLPIEAWRGGYVDFVPIVAAFAFAFGAIGAVVGLIPALLIARLRGALANRVK
ncbi:hypothetical protein EAH87_10805 [Sphingomonas koreensis]|nr:hypothetical protein EAH87_10805 [Sphingomonas koreensis]